MLYTLRARCARVSYVCNRITHTTYRVTCRHYGTESHAHTNIYTSILIPQPYTYTHTEKANPFFVIQNQAGGWAKPKPFPWRGYGFKMGI